MKKIIIMLFILLLYLNSTAQNAYLESKKLNQYSKTKHISGQFIGKTDIFNDQNGSKSDLLNESFEAVSFPPAGWTKINNNANTTYQWKRDNLSPNTGIWGARIEYSVSNQNEWLISPSVNLSLLNTPVLEFWWNMSYYWGVSPNNNYDFKIKVSVNGGSSWTTVWTEDSAGSFENFKYYKKEISLLPYQNASDFKVAFQYIGADGADLYIDDIKIGELPANRLEFSKIWAGYSNYLSPIENWSGYSKIPYGQKFRVGLAADIKNTGSNTQNNTKFIAKELLTNSITNSLPKNLSMFSNDTLEIDSLTTLENIGNYKIAMYATSDSVLKLNHRDTFNINVNRTALTIGSNTVYTGTYSRDNNFYDGWGSWGGSESGSTKPFQFANLYEFNQNAYASSIEVVLSGLTKANSSPLIKTLLYRGWDWDNKTLIAESDYHTISANEIPSATSNNPVAINLFFANNETPLLEKDSAYFAAVQGFGGSDTVYIAIGSNIPQPSVTSFVYDYTSNSWKWSDVDKDPKMIRLKVVDQPIFIGIDEFNFNQPKLYQNTPNPAKESTKISFEIKKSENVLIEIFDLTGKKISSYNLGKQSTGFHSLNINLSGITPGTYFYSLKTTDYQKTLKMIIW